MSKITKYALMNAFVTAAYIVLVVLFMNFISGRLPGDDSNPLTGVTFIMLLVFSVAFVGSAIFGRPVMWYIDGKKKEALALLGGTLGIFLVIFVIVFAIVMIVLG